MFLNEGMSHQVRHNSLTKTELPIKNLCKPKSLFSFCCCKKIENWQALVSFWLCVRHVYCSLFRRWTLGMDGMWRMNCESFVEINRMEHKTMWNRRRGGWQPHRDNSFIQRDQRWYELWPQSLMMKSEQKRPVHFTKKMNEDAMDRADGGNSRRWYLERNIKCWSSESGSICGRKWKITFRVGTFLQMVRECRIRRYWLRIWVYRSSF